MIEISRVGIIANPNSGKDIRRLVGYGSVCDNIEKTDIIKRILIGLDAMGVDEIVFMPDTYNFSSVAVEGMNKQDRERLEGKVSSLKMSMYGTDRDSIIAGKMMNDMNVDCIIVLGGDGTSRAVAMGCGYTPIMPISTGTNNVFPFKIEGTLAGFVAGFYSTNKLQKEKVMFKAKQIELFINGELKNIALVDLVIYDDPFIATKALWKPGKIMFIAVTRADAGNMGISSVISNFKSISPNDGYGLYCYLGEKNSEFYVKAALAPGLIRELPIQSYEELQLDRRIKIKVETDHRWVTIALDGEREHEVDLQNHSIEIQIRYGKLNVLDSEKILREAVDKGMLVSKVRR